MAAASESPSDTVGDGLVAIANFDERTVPGQLVPASLERFAGCRSGVAAAWNKLL